jgi:hypothetical protein
LWDYRIKVAKWLNQIAERIDRPQNELGKQSKFIDLAPTDKADEAGVYSDALTEATNNPRVLNIALTGPYGSGKSSIIKSFLKRYKGSVLQISLAAFLSETMSAGGQVSRQEIERSILQQMLYGADANKLPLSRFKRIQSPGRGAAFVSLFIVLGILACWHLFQQRADIVKGTYFLPFGISNGFNLACFVVGGWFLWRMVHRFYVASFGISLKSISLKDIEITPEAATEESILNRHLDEIIYFFQSTKYDLVIIEDLDRFDNTEIFITLREINSLVNANSGVKRTIRFLYALRDNMFVNTDRTKFFEFIVPVIPIINSSNSIDKMLEQGTRLSLDNRLDRQFLREVSRYLSDLRLIQNIFNEYAIYVANLETDGENVLDANKLLAVLIYKNVFPSDFENLHRRKGNLATILDRHDEFIANAEAEYKAEISSLEEEIDIGESQIPTDLNELRRIYAMALIEHLPEGTTFVSLDGGNYISINAVRENDLFEQILEAQHIHSRNAQGHQQTLSMVGFHAKLDHHRTFQQRKGEIQKKSADFRGLTSNTIRDLRAKMSTLRVAKFNQIIRRNAEGVTDLFKPFGDNAELARFLVLEGFLDDTYYQYTSLFHSGRLSPNDNKFLIQIRAYINPEPDFQVDNPKEVIAAMRDEDFGQSYVLNVKIVDCLLSESSAYTTQTAKLFEFIATDFGKCEPFFTAYYASGVAVSALVSALVNIWAGFVPAAMVNTTNLQHMAHIITRLPTTDLAALPGKYPGLSGFVSANLPQILALGIDFEPSRLKLLQIESTDLAGIASYPGIGRLLFDEGLYKLSISNLDFIFRSILGIEDEHRLHKQHYTTVLRTENEVLTAKIDGGFSEYLESVLLKSEGNTDESVQAILSVINREELEIEALKVFLDKQSALVPSLDQASPRLHAALFELAKIEASWENCEAFLSSENYDANALTGYLNMNHIAATLSQFAVPDGERALPLQKFLIENEALDDDVYASYVRALPRPFEKFPEDLSWAKLQILIEEKKVSFSSENLSFLSEDRDVQLLFVTKNTDRYLEIESECALDDDFRERLLSSDVRDEQKLKIIKAMDLTLLASMPSRAAQVGPILFRTGAEVGEFGADAAVVIIVSSRPIYVQIPLFNKFQQKLDDQQVRSILSSLPNPFSEIKPGYVTPRIESTDANLEFVRWLEARRFISSWGQGGLFGLDDDIRINLRRK